MSSAAERILEQALELPEDERRRVAERLLDSMPLDAAEQVERAWNEEAARRAGSLERGEVRTLDGPGALSQLEDKLRSVHEG